MTTGIKKQCDRVVVWDEAAGTGKGSFVAYKAGTNCPGSESLPEHIREIALAGTRVARIERTAGHREYLELKVASLGTAKPASADDRENGSGASGLVEGDYLGNLRGDGELLAYNTWHVCTLLPPGYADEYDIAEPCEGEQPPVSEVEHSIDEQSSTPTEAA